MTLRIIIITVCFLFMAQSASAVSNADYFKITVVDEETGRGVPLVRVQTNNKIEHYTDSAGVVAIYEPELFGKKVFFSVWSHGYERAKDGFGSSGKPFIIEPGGSGEIEMTRINLAQRLYRITGSGMYSDSILVGDTAPIENPLGYNTITGQDSVITTLYKGNIFWIWGDTGSLRHPIAGNYKVTAATSLLLGEGGLDPEEGVNLHYFTKGDFVKEMADVESAPCWFGNLQVFKDLQKKDHLMASYATVDKAMKATERGWVEFDDEEEIFRPVLKIPLDADIHPTGRSFPCKADGVDYVYFFSNSLARIRDSYEAIFAVDEYEAFTCLKEGINLKEDAPEIARDEGGRILYRWRKGTSLTGKEELNQFEKDGLIEPEERWIRLIDIETGDDIQAHGLTVNWNEYRQRWIMIYTQFFGSSLLGEMWYAEADSPLGPWTYTRKIMTHDTYSFYNPLQHPYFAKEGGRQIFFEGTYTEGFSGNKNPTPRYDYNQIMYKLELDSPQLMLPVAIYTTDSAEYNYLPFDRIPRDVTGKEVAFYAPDRPREGTVPVYRTFKDGRVALSTGEPAGASIAFYAVPADLEQLPPFTFPVIVGTDPVNGNDIYLPGEISEETEQQKDEDVLFHAWKKPSSFNPFE